VSHPRLHGTRPRGALSVSARQLAAERAVRVGGWSVERAAAHFGVACGTIMSWLDRIDEAAADARNLVEPERGESDGRRR
jgi:transposase